jgi:hypothetical protein
MTAASGSVWAWGAFTHNKKTMETGQKTTQAVFVANAIAGVLRSTRRKQSLAAGNALRTFAFAGVIGRQYPNKPALILAAYGFAAAASYSRRPDQTRFPTDVLVNAAVGEIIGRLMARHHEPK